jgi:hypothetical protein
LIHFLLTPDKSASLALKRLVAQQGARMDVVVGTWPELLALTKNCHVLPVISDDWLTRLTDAIKQQADAFWSGSLKNVEAEADSITAIVGQTLTMFLEAVGPNSTLADFALPDVSHRIQQRFNDLNTLHSSMRNILPRDLALIRQLLDANEERRLRNIRVYHQEDWSKLNPWQHALTAYLNNNADCAPDISLAALQSDVFACPTALRSTALHHLQSNLFVSTSNKLPLDNTLQWLAVRDYLQEIEVVAGMVQKAMADDSSLAFKDMALLLPDDDRYLSTVNMVFSHAGIPLSGLGVDTTERDMGGEAILNLLLSLHKPAPVIAMASLFASLLMPWKSVEGNRLAQEVMKSRFKLAPEKREDDAGKMLGIICDGVSTPQALRVQLQRFSNSLNRDELLEAHRKRAQSLCNDLAAFLEGRTGEIPWSDLHKRIVIQPQPVASPPDLFREAVTVFHEGLEPWRRVRRLFVLGCSEGHYPTEAPRSKVFTDAELSVLSDVTGLKLDTSTDRNGRQRQLFRRQCCNTTDEITFLVPRRDPFGKSLAHSTSLTFAATLFSNVDDDEKLALELDREDDRGKARGLPLATEEFPKNVVKSEFTELNLGCNLLELGKKADGTLKPESPSRLEKLMVSPLAWLFERLGVEPREWQPETLDVMSQGTLAHHVFEHLFKRGVPLPSAEFIEQEVPMLLEEGIRQISPFLNRDEWKVEREHLKKDILKAALRWGEILNAIGAEVVATELSLKGVLGDVPIHGNADLLLELQGERLLVVDYKKSSSKGRRTRMKQGYDHQAELYRTMIKTGGLEYPEKAEEGLEEKISFYKNAGEIGTLYYLMNDQTALTDTTDWISASTGEAVDADTSAFAMKLINDRFSELKGGRVDLKLMESEKVLKDKLGLGTYALDSSPLVRMFVKEPDKPE